MFLVTVITYSFPVTEWLVTFELNNLENQTPLSNAITFQNRSASLRKCPWCICHSNAIVYQDLFTRFQISRGKDCTNQTKTWVLEGMEPEKIKVYRLAAVGHKKEDN